MAGENSTRNVMGNYFKKTDTEEVTLGFQPANPTTLEVKTVVMNELRNNQFKGDSSQDPWEHLVKFNEICALQKRPEHTTDDQKKLFMFAYSLTQQAKDWLYCLPTKTIQTWKELEGKFLDRFFTEDQFKERKAELMNFQQHKKECLYQSHERFKLLKRRCPNHQICAAELMYIFINGMKQKQRMFLDASAGGTIQNKTPAEVEELIEKMCENKYNKMEDEEETLQDQLEERKRKEHIEKINKLQREEDSKKQQESYTTQITNLESVIVQLAKNMGEHIQSSNAQIQHLINQVSDLKDEQCKAIELRNRLVDITERPKKSKKAKDNGTDHSQQEVPAEEAVTEEEREPGTEPEVRIEINQPVFDNNQTPSQSTPILNTRLPEIFAPYPTKDGKKEKEKVQNRQFEGYLKQMEINIPLGDMLRISPPFHKYVKNVVAGKIKLQDKENIELTAECSAIFQKTLPRKCKDPGSFTISCTIGGVEIGRALCDLGASVNLMPLSIMKKLNCGEAKPTRMTLILADRTRVYPHGILEDVLVRVDDTIFPADFVIMDIEEDDEAPILLGRPFLTTFKALIDMETREIKFRVDGNEVTFNINNMVPQKKEKPECYKVDIVETLVKEQLETPAPGIQRAILQSLKAEEEGMEEETNLSVRWLNREAHCKYPQKYKPLEFDPNEKPKPLELKELPPYLKYIFLGEGKTKPAIISNSLPPEREERLIKMEEEYKPVVQPQRRLNPVMNEVVRKEVNKLLAAGMIYPISDSPWVSPVHVVPKKGGITVMKNEKNELIPTRNVTG
ncbi:hypothetical protein L195_g010162 [Trifolium pratense]|uniref:Retrotransposon gag domain-containing protein n=1 Tax=Trifolium pratense TaxID=57577 RepID=A0A2K3PDY6_TRIPR|nr:hypothetical protein L195_g010162 [Trifolium pratense]